MTSMDAPARRPRVICPPWAWKSAISASFQAASSGVLDILIPVVLSIRVYLPTIRSNHGGDVKVGAGLGGRDDQVAGHGGEWRSRAGSAEEVHRQVEVLKEVPH